MRGFSSTGCRGCWSHLALLLLWCEELQEELSSPVQELGLAMWGTCVGQPAELEPSQALKNPPCSCVLCGFPFPSLLVGDALGGRWWWWWWLCGAGAHCWGRGDHSDTEWLEMVGQGGRRRIQQQWDHHGAGYSRSRTCPDPSQDVSVSLTASASRGAVVLGLWGGAGPGDGSGALPRRGEPCEVGVAAAPCSAARGSSGPAARHVCAWQMSHPPFPTRGGLGTLLGHVRGSSQGPPHVSGEFPWQAVDG